MRRATLLLAALIVAAGSPAPAQTPVAPKRRPPAPAAAPLPQAPAARTAPTLPAAPARLTLTGLRSPGDGGATCRSTCARTRYACEVQEESCAAQWTSCLKTCSDVAAVPTDALLPR